MHSCLVFEVASMVLSSENKFGGPCAWALCSEGASLGLGNGGKTLLMHFQILEFVKLILFLQPRVHKHRVKWGLGAASCLRVGTVD